MKTYTLREKTRLHQTITKVKTRFERGSVFIHLTWDGDRIVGGSLSHQIQDARPPEERSPVADALDVISSALCAAIKAGPYVDDEGASDVRREVDRGPDPGVRR